jgi:hypothetical protein
MSTINAPLSPETNEVRLRELRRRVCRIDICTFKSRRIPRMSDASGRVCQIDADDGLVGKGAGNPRDEIMRNRAYA